MSRRFRDLRGRLGLGCFIALEEAVDIAPAALMRAFAETVPRSFLSVERRATGAEGAGLSAKVDGMAFAMLVAPHPLEPEQLLEAGYANVFWPEGPAEIAPHRAVIAIVGEERERGHGRVRAQAIALTKLAAAVAEITPSLGVYWPIAETLAAPERLPRAVRELGEGKWPVDLWIGYTFFGVDEPGEPLLVGVQSRGAVDYFGFEIEVPPFEVERRSEPIYILLGAAGYLMNFGDVIPDGQLVEVIGAKRTKYELHLGRGDQTGLAQLRVLEPGQQPGARQG